MALERVDFCFNHVDVGRLWIEGNPLTEVEDNYRIAYFDFFHKERKTISLDGTMPKFYERRGVAPVAPEQMRFAREVLVPASLLSFRSCQRSRRDVMSGQQCGNAIRDRTVAVSGCACAIGVAWCFRQTEETQSEMCRRSERRWGTAGVFAWLSADVVTTRCTLVVHVTA